MTTLRRTLDDTARRAIAARTEALFRASGALREGHFVLKSGRHSDAYLEKFQVLQDPAATSELCAFWAAAHRDDDGAAAVDLVAGPDDGRRDPRVRDRPPARDPGHLRGGGGDRRRRPRREFRRGFTIGAGERVLLVDDILTTGGSLLAMIPAVEAAGGEIVECVVLVDRSGGLSTLTSPATGRVYPLRAPVAARAADLRARRGDLSAMRGRRARGQAREQRDGRGSRVSRRPDALAAGLAPRGRDRRGLRQPARRRPLDPSARHRSARPRAARRRRRAGLAGRRRPHPHRLRPA